MSAIKIKGLVKRKDNEYYNLISVISLDGENLQHSIDSTKKNMKNNLLLMDNLKEIMQNEKKLYEKIKKKEKICFKVKGNIKRVKNNRKEIVKKYYEQDDNLLHDDLMNNNSVNNKCVKHIIDYMKNVKDINFHGTVRKKTEHDKINSSRSKRIHVHNTTHSPLISSSQYSSRRYPRYSSSEQNKLNYIINLQNSVNLTNKHTNKKGTCGTKTDRGLKYNSKLLSNSKRSRFSIVHRNIKKKANRINNVKQIKNTQSKISLLHKNLEDKNKIINYLIRKLKKQKQNLQNKQLTYYKSDSTKGEKIETKKVVSNKKSDIHYNSRSAKTQYQSKFSLCGKVAALRVCVDYEKNKLYFKSLFKSIKSENSNPEQAFNKKKSKENLLLNSGKGTDNFNPPSDIYSKTFKESKEKLKEIIKKRYSQTSRNSTNSCHTMLDDMQYYGRTKEHSTIDENSDINEAKTYDLNIIKSLISIKENGAENFHHKQSITDKNRLNALNKKEKHGDIEKSDNTDDSSDITKNNIVKKNESHIKHLKDENHKTGVFKNNSLNHTPSMKSIKLEKTLTENNYKKTESSKENSKSVHIIKNTIAEDKIINQKSLSVINGKDKKDVDKYENSKVTGLPNRLSSLSNESNNNKWSSENKSNVINKSVHTELPHISKASLYHTDNISKHEPFSITKNDKNDMLNKEEAKILNKSLTKNKCNDSNNEQNLSKGSMLKNDELKSKSNLLLKNNASNNNTFAYEKQKNNILKNENKNQTEHKNINDTLSNKNEEKNKETKKGETINVTNETKSFDITKMSILSMDSANNINEKENKTQSKEISIKKETNANDIEVFKINNMNVKNNQNMDIKNLSKAFSNSTSNAQNNSSNNDMDKKALSKTMNEHNAKNVYTLVNKNTPLNNKTISLKKPNLMDVKKENLSGNILAKINNKADTDDKSDKNDKNDNIINKDETVSSSENTQSSKVNIMLLKKSNIAQKKSSSSVLSVKSKSMEENEHKGVNTNIEIKKDNSTPKNNNIIKNNLNSSSKILVSKNVILKSEAIKTKNSKHASFDDSLSNINKHSSSVFSKDKTEEKNEETTNILEINKKNQKNVFKSDASIKKVESSTNDILKSVSKMGNDINNGVNKKSQQITLQKKVNATDLKDSVNSVKSLKILKSQMSAQKVGTSLNERTGFSESVVKKNIEKILTNTDNSVNSDTDSNNPYKGLISNIFFEKKMDTNSSLQSKHSIGKNKTINNEKNENSLNQMNKTSGNSSVIIKNNIAQTDVLRNNKDKNEKEDSEATFVDGHHKKQVELPKSNFTLPIKEKKATSNLALSKSSLNPNSILINKLSFKNTLSKDAMKNDINRVENKKEEIKENDVNEKEKNQNSSELLINTKNVATDIKKNALTKSYSKGPFKKETVPEAQSKNEAPKVDEKKSDNGTTVPVTEQENTQKLANIMKNTPKIKMSNVNNSHEMNTTKNNEFISKFQKIKKIASTKEFPIQRLSGKKTHSINESDINYNNSANNNNANINSANNNSANNNSANNNCNNSDNNNSVNNSDNNNSANINSAIIIVVMTITTLIRQKKKQTVVKIQIY
ncbi:conserved protein, unknown function [Hepatocystis sp. ex Piliocolobus tephrosceles]|nr:conserved protein, unknown function [Hepatocystis sp. ex Piliocolobus tephrosceles]